MENENRQKRLAEFSKKIILFYSGLLFTCIIGIIELLPEIENIKGVFDFLCISVIYFVLLFGAIISLRSSFAMYQHSIKNAGKYGFIVPIFEPFSTKGRSIRDSLTLGMLVVFTLLFLAKIGVLP